MIACVAPSDYDETLSTLRYADQAKKIRTRAIRNEDLVSAAERDAQIVAMAEEIRALQYSVSENRRKEKEGKDQEEKLEEYQNRVVVMQRMMEERSLVAEGKIRSLQTENEALRNHLKLALEELKAPINLQRNSTRNSYRGGSVTRDLSEEEPPLVYDDEGPPTPTAESDIDDHTEVPDSEYPSDEAVDLARQAYTDETEECLKSLLNDLGLHRKKIMSDKLRFYGDEVAH
ncbi:putative Kinesin-related protein 1 [Glarea lozoyensis 74030]|nr:putative Kinesin-related protein 1 [Glarea lozoyensis 74030]